MYLKQRRQSTDPRMRSLLQKAARRGCVEVVDRVSAYLAQIGDTTWLRSRSVVITFEESWPLAESLHLDKTFISKRSALLRVARASKQKDSAGLGSLGFAFQSGEQEVLKSVSNERAVKIVAEAIERPEDFFAWACNACISERGRRIVKAAAKYIGAATWPWDKAFILAGAYLAATSEVPTTSDSGSIQTAAEFPYWVALDKHTDEGKVALRAVSKQIGSTYRQLIWAGFYFESAVVNSQAESPWFDAERCWRLRRAGLQLDEARQLWDRARPLVRASLQAESERLKCNLESNFGSTGTFDLIGA